MSSSGRGKRGLPNSRIPVSKDRQRRNASLFASDVRSMAKKLRRQKHPTKRSDVERTRGSIRGRGYSRGRGRGRGESQCRGGDTAGDTPCQYDSDNDGDDNIDMAEDDIDGQSTGDLRRAQQIQLFRGEGVFSDLNPEDLEEILAMADGARAEEDNGTSTGVMEDSSHPSSTMQNLFRLVMLGIVVPGLNMNPFPYNQSSQNTE